MTGDDVTFGLAIMIGASLAAGAVVTLIVTAIVRYFSSMD